MRLVGLALLLSALLGSERRELRLIEVDPGHSHAAALHATMPPGFSTEAHVYAPLGTDLTAHLNRIAQFNSRVNNPAGWSLKVFAGPDFLRRMQEEPPGNVVVLSGRNQKKIDYLEAALASGQNVLADKPWIVEAENLPRLERALDLADRKGLIAYDCMTQRFDPAYQLQRRLVGDPDVFGSAVPGSPEAPAVRMANLHALFKRPSLRPAWFFDIRQQGEGMTDVGTHLVDLVEWTLFPGQGIDYRTGVRVLRAERSPTILTREQFEQVTGIKAWPEDLREAVREDRLPYFSNNKAIASLRGIHVEFDVRWEFEAAPGANDSYFASYQGSTARIELREGAAEHYISEVFVVPASPEDVRGLLVTLRKKYSDFSFQEEADGIHAIIPPAIRKPGTDHFAALAGLFLQYVRNPGTLPKWEKANMMAKYYITTKAVELARRGRT